jgi:hypothetical protein
MLGKGCGTLGIPHAHITGPAGLKEKNQYNRACSLDTKYTRVSIPKLKKCDNFLPFVDMQAQPQRKRRGGEGTKKSEGLPRRETEREREKTN